MKQKSPWRRIAAHYALTPSGLIPWALATIAEDGTILSIESREGVDSLYGVEFYSGIMIPGMVNAHTHLELSYLRNRIAPGGGFIAFANGLSAVRNDFTREEMKQAADYRDARMFADGVSAVADISNSDVTFGIKNRSRIHYHSFLELFGLDAHGGEMCPLLEKAHAHRLSATITPHSTYSLNDAAFCLAVGSDDNSPLSIHFMESREEEELFTGTGKMHEWYSGRGFGMDFMNLYVSPVERIVRCVPPDRRVLLVHNTFITHSEVDMLAAHFGDNVTFVLCPRSNLYINNAEPPAKMLYDAGVRVAVGTDSLASNGELSMIDELKTLHNIPLETLLRWATLSGAQALGIDYIYGSLETGKRPGVAVIEGVDWSNMKLLPSAKTRRIV